MGSVFTTIILSNPKRDDLKPVELYCLVDTGATHLVIPMHVSIQLALDTLENRQVTLADGQSVLHPYVGPIKVTFENRSCFVGAMAMGDLALLGAIPMEDLDLVVHPKLLKVTVNPQYPNIPHALAM